MIRTNCSTASARAAPGRRFALQAGGDGAHQRLY
jgi:hypothetical protein